MNIAVSQVQYPPNSVDNDYQVMGKIALDQAPIHGIRVYRGSSRVRSYLVRGQGLHLRIYYAFNVACLRVLVASPRHEVEDHKTVII